MNKEFKDEYLARYVELIMWPELKSLYHAFYDIIDWHNRKSFDMEYSRKHDVFKDIHHLLTHYANISKLFYPVEEFLKDKEIQKVNWKYSKKRGSRLRELFKITEGELNDKDRNMRNNLEHFDSRFDRVIRDSKLKNIVDGSKGPKSFLKIPEPDYFLRSYDPEKLEFTFFEEVFNIQEKIAEIEPIYCKCKDLMDGHDISNKIRNELNKDE